MAWNHDDAFGGAFQKQRLYEMEAQKARYQMEQEKAEMYQQMAAMKAKIDWDKMHPPFPIPDGVIKRKPLPITRAWLASYEEALTEAAAARWVVGL